MKQLMCIVRNVAYGRVLSWCILFAMLLAPNVLLAQNLSISGQVISGADKTAVIGAIIQIDGQSVGSATDMDGKFTISSPVNEGTLIVSYPGFESQRVSFNRSKTNYPITLSEEVQSIDEVVVTGYGTMKKKEVTGAVARVDSEELTKISTSDLGTALQGLIAGVNVQASSGEPGAASNVQIRGLSSISGSNSPLYVVDGVPYDSDPGLSANEIASVDVLKDAASAAIYGTRGAGGVILITTKQGKEGRMKVSVDINSGVQKITSDVNLVNASERTFILALINRESDSATPTDNKLWTSLLQYSVNFFNDSNLYDVIINDLAPVQNYSANISGGRSGLTYSFSANYFSQDGTLVNSSFDRYNIRTNVNYKQNKFTFNSSVGFILQSKASPGWGLLTEAYKASPSSSQIDPNQSTTTVGGQDSEISNFGTVMGKILETNDNDTETLTGNFFLGYDLIKGLNVSSRIGFTYGNSKTVQVNPAFELYDDEGELKENSSYRSGVRNTQTRNTNLIWENMLNYNKQIRKHNIKFTGVFSVEQATQEQFYAQIKDLVGGDLGSLNMGTADKQVGTGTGQWGQDRTTSLVGMLGRLQYNYASKYMLSASIRRDGSSRFAPENRWGMFPSASAAWNFSEEKFWQPFKRTFNSAKLRLSYGTTGNQNFADYAYAAAVSTAYDYAFGASGNENLWSGITQTAFANPDVVWETTQQVNAGIDLSMLKNKLTFTLDYYESDKSDMLFPMLVPPSNGTGEKSTVILNAGNMENKGVEFAVRYRGNLKSLWYNMNLTFTRNENTITKMAGTSDMYFFADGNPISSLNKDYVTVIKEGYEAGAFFVMPTDGIINTQQKLAEYQKLVSSARMGDLMYVDTNQDGVLDDDDRVYGGSGQSEYEIGYNFSAGYKGFDFSMNWYASLGNEIINATKIYTYQEMTNPDLMYMWTETNPTSTIPTFRGVKTHDSFRQHTDMWVEDGSFLRLKNLTLGYSLPKKTLDKIGLSKVRFYVAADNLWTITPYTGYDPEVGNNGLSRRGLDYGTYPITTQLRGGCQIQF